MKRSALTVAWIFYIPVMIIAALVREVCDWLLNLPFPRWRV